jgi:hypothetical protein
VGEADADDVSLGRVLRLALAEATVAMLDGLVEGKVATTPLPGERLNNGRTTTSTTIRPPTAAPTKAALAIPPRNDGTAAFLKGSDRTRSGEHTWRGETHAMGPAGP